MIIRNIGTKIINIGSTVLMPDAETDVSDTVAAAPAIQTLISMGLIAAVSEKKASATPDPESKGEETKKGTDIETGKKGSAEKKAGSST